MPWSEVRQVPTSDELSVYFIEVLFVEMSFDGDSLSRYYSVHVQPNPPFAPRYITRPRQDLPFRAGRLFGGGRLGPPRGRAAAGARTRAHAGRGGPERFVPDSPVGDGPCRGAALRCPADRARHPRARGSRLSRESDEPLLLLQDGAVAPAVSRGAASRARYRVRRHERGRPARAPSRVRRRAGGGRAFAARRGGTDEGGCPACRARARASGMGCTGGAVPFEPRGLRHPDHVGASRAGGAGGSVPAAARRDGGSAGPPPWRPGGRAHRGRTALGSLGYRAAAGNQGTPHGLGLRGGGRRSSRLPPRRSARRARPARVRLFVALNLPAPVREALWAATARARDLGLPVKWVRGEGLHLTLKFLGDVADEREPELAAALTRAAA